MLVFFIQPAKLGKDSKELERFERIGKERIGENWRELKRLKIALKAGENRSNRGLYNPQPFMVFLLPEEARLQVIMEELGKRKPAGLDSSVTNNTKE